MKLVTHLPAKEARSWGLWFLIRVRRERADASARRQYDKIAQVARRSVLGFEP